MSAPEARPWYREPLVWLLIAFPVSAVVGGFVTLALAIKTNDGLVADDYYWQGLQINRVLDRDRKAADEGIGANVVFDYQRAIVKVRLVAHPAVNFPAALQLSFLNATRARHDRTLELPRALNGDYEAPLPDLVPGHWYVQIEATDWRLLGSVRIPEENQVRIASEFAH
jgi:hypothetical protein